MRPLLAIFALVPALTGCQPGPFGSATAVDPLARSLSGQVAGPAQSCIAPPTNQNVMVIDASTVAYDVGRTLWVNRLQHACPSLSPHNNVIIEHGGAQVCRGDRVRGLEPGASIPGPSCNLQDWVPYRTR